jgi:PAS domain S-box-containing protein
VRGSSGEIQGAVLIFQDITELRQAAQAVQESEARFRSLIHSMTDVIVTFDPSLLITGVYGRAIDFFGISQEDAVGKSLDELLGANAARHIENVRLALNGEVVTYEWDLSTIPNKFFQTSLSPLMSEPGHAQGVVGVVRDITAIKRAELALETYAARLEGSNRELEQFAFIASHDLQEPLRKIHAFGERVRLYIKEDENAEARDYLERMVKASRRMQKMIQDLLAYSRVTTKGQPFKLVSLTDVAREVINDLEVSIERSGGRVVVGALPVIEADPLQMHQLLQNLIGNGLKYHRPGVPPEVQLRAEEIRDISDAVDSENGGIVRLTIQDNGIGFDEEYLERILQPFERLHGRSEYEGTGMGLAICKKIVERHRGNITAYSKPGQGAVFVIDLPVSQDKRKDY